ncbi:MAG: 3-hydroxyacyl-CoA dehydrogenase family protein [Actinomycetota bacterium]|nr:3-hydroxyacyl-CoA dehydrogenase family protein [Actinomycetota bacterium]
MFVFKAAVVGAGTMGGEIAQVIAAADLPVVLKDVDRAMVDHGLEKAREVTRAQAAKLAARGKISEAGAEAMVEEVAGRITGTTAYDDFGDVDLVVEAVPEQMEIKRAVFSELDSATPGHAVLASNTSGLSITELGEGTSRPDKVVGFHFFWPASVMRLIEVIEGDDTSQDTLRVALGFAQTLRKQPIHCADSPGFVVNRILTSIGSELWRAHREERLDPEEIDRRITESKAAPMGPFYLADMAGLDTTLHVAEQMRSAYGERFFVSPAMRELVEAGHLGQKTGKGFYEHGG